MVNKSQTTNSPSSLKEFVKMRSTALQDKMRDALEEREKQAHKEVLQTKIDSNQNYDIDGVSMDQGGVRIATEKTPPKRNSPSKK